MTDDRELVAAALARKPGAFEALVQRHQRVVWHLIHRMVREPEQTRELSQEVFLRVHRQLGQFRFESALGTWIGRIAFTVANKHMQRKRLDLVEDADDAEPLVERVADAFDLEAACANQQLVAHMREALAGLPPLQRTVITLYHLDELTIPEVSRITGLPAGTIKSHLFRARLRLKQALDIHAGTPA